MPSIYSDYHSCRNTLLGCKNYTRSVTCPVCTDIGIPGTPIRDAVDEMEPYIGIGNVTFIVASIIKQCVAKCKNQEVQNHEAPKIS